jgi:hypothetical protein
VPHIPHLGTLKGVIYTRFICVALDFLRHLKEIKDNEVITDQYSQQDQAIEQTTFILSHIDS